MFGSDSIVPFLDNHHRFWWKKSRWTPLKLNYMKYLPTFFGSYFLVFPFVLHLFSAASSPSFFPFLNSLLIHTRHHVHYIVIIFVIKVLTPFLHTKSKKLNTTHAAALVLSDRKIQCTHLFIITIRSLRHHYLVLHKKKEEIFIQNSNQTKCIICVGSWCNKTALCANNTE